MDDFLGTLAVLPLETTAARRAGTLLATLDRAGRPMPELDALIAAVTLENGGRIVSRNKRHFARVQGLEVIAG